MQKKLEIRGKMTAEEREEGFLSRGGMRKLQEEGSDSESRMSPAAGPRQAYRKRDDTLRGCCAAEVGPERTFAAYQHVDTSRPSCAFVPAHIYLD